MSVDGSGGPSMPVDPSCAPVPETDDDELNVDDEENLPEIYALQTIPEQEWAHCFAMEIVLSTTEIDQRCSKQGLDQAIYLASQAKRQKVEIKMQDLKGQEYEEMMAAKCREIDSWLATETVRRIARHKIPEEQILKTRWVLTWKPLDAQEQAELGKCRKAKARLVILGFQDPDVEKLGRDAPTLSRDSRALILQLLSSARWEVNSFDIRTAFLRGTRQDNRVLGIEPPAEMRAKLKLQDHEVCELLKSAYGLVNAPLLWYSELKATLLDLGFIMSPFDPCVFVLPRDVKTLSEAATTDIHGIIGIHVDDGIGGGDQEFHKKLKCLEAKFPFGSHRKRDMIFTGLHIHQMANGEIQVDQKEYIQDIPPIQVSKDRRADPKNPVLPPELQSFRGLIGSLQYAATNTRPDIACRLSLLQAKIPTATVEDLLEGNRLLMEAKKHSNVSVKYRTIPIQKIRFATFSDAAFASREKAHSQKGCLVLTTSDQIDHDVSAPISALAWYSKKISRVVGNTLASETYALSGAVDLLGWLRIHWAWLICPSINWQKLEQVYSQIPKAFAIVDCKSLYDLLQKTSIPQCSEYRTTLEALIIKSRLNEGVAVKWVHSAAQMADALTKNMDATPLRLLLEQGCCRIHDIDVVLQQRADKKLRNQWIQDSSSTQ